MSISLFDWSEVVDRAAQDIIGVQPMSNPCGEIFLMNVRYPRPNTSKYNFSRAKWHRVDLSSINNANSTEINSWCTEHFGPMDKHIDAWSRWKHYSWCIWEFRDEDDAILFKLRWL